MGNMIGQNNTSQNSNFVDPNKPQLPDAFSQHMKGITAREVEASTRLRSKRLSGAARPKYDFDTVVSNKSQAMNLRQLFSEQSVR